MMRGAGVEPRPKEAMMTNRAHTRRQAAMGLIAIILLFLLISSCTPPKGPTFGPTTEYEVTTEYFLERAGFAKLPVNDETPKRQALLMNLPKGKISTYMRNGWVYHVYPDERSQFLYMGDEAAYRRYLALAHGRKLCEQVTGANQEKFWVCMEDYEERGPRPRR